VAVEEEENQQGGALCCRLKEEKKMAGGLGRKKISKGRGRRIVGLFLAKVGGSHCGLFF
jgi:hypothetical protein